MGADQADLEGITAARIALLVTCVADGTSSLGLAFTIEDVPTRLLVERLAQLVCLYASSAAASLGQDLEGHLSAVLHELDMRRQLHGSGPS